MLLLVLTNNTDNNKIQYFYFMPAINENYIQCFTAVCTDWLPLLKNDECKEVIIRALKYGVQTKEVGGWVCYHA